MPQRSSLFVEGNDDQHVIKHLLRRYGVECPFAKEVIRDTLSSQIPEIILAGNKDKVLDAMTNAIKFGTGHSVGFVVDADDAASNSWQAVRQRLSFLDQELPRTIPATGFVTEVSEYEVRFGVWLMPDNSTPGTLEHFLHDLVDPNDSLISLARESTTAALDRGAKFSDIKYLKAVTHTWLAWQEEPGRPFGTAIAARYFNVDSPIAQLFVSWFNELYGTEAAGNPS